MRDHNEDQYTIHIDSFNNKGQKGDDDFETWLETESPLLGDTTLSIVDNASMYNTYATTSSYANKSINTKSLKYSMPIDILYKWYPVQMKEIENDDEVPF